MQTSGQTKVSGTRKEENTKAPNLSNTSALQKTKPLASLPKDFVDLPALSDEDDSDVCLYVFLVVSPLCVLCSVSLIFMLGARKCIQLLLGHK